MRTRMMLLTCAALANAWWSGGACALAQPPEAAAHAGAVETKAGSQAAAFVGEWRLDEKKTAFVITQNAAGQLVIEMPAEPNQQAEIRNVELQAGRLSFDEIIIDVSPDSEARYSAVVSLSVAERTVTIESELSIVPGNADELNYRIVAEGKADPVEHLLTRGDPNLDDGSPYGCFGEVDSAAFKQLVAKHGVDLDRDEEKLRAADAETLSRFFAISLEFEQLDLQARIYAHAVYCLNLNAYTYAIYHREEGLRALRDLVATIKSQPPAVRQRIIDIIVCGPTFASDEESQEFKKKISALSEEETDPTWLLLIDHKYGEGDPVFAPWPNRVREDESDLSE
ncbi:hypothetical protein [Lacipirellula sp.]|uniref:hypothetical protein n=1 Tax=Lacipirellula sp. TaxID=2691419 RepID=UPI003D0C88E1